MTGAPHVVHLVQPIRSTRAEIWQACRTPLGLSGWYADLVEGEVETGGTVSLSWPDLGARVELRVAECSTEGRVAFDNGESRVTLSVEEGALSLTHEGLGEGDDIAGFRSSWRIALAHLAQSLEVHRRRRRLSRWLVRRARTSAELSHLCFTEPSALEAWLGRPARLGLEGERYSVTLEDGRPLSGRVLVREPGHDVALTWEGIGGDSVVSLRTLPSPRGESERLVAISWSTWAEPGEQMEADPTLVRLLSTAADRLTTVLSRRGDA